MMTLKKVFKPITVLFYAGFFIYFIAYKHLPISSLILPYVLYFIIYKLIFLGDTIGSIGLIVHIITKNDQKARPFYDKANQLHTTKSNILASYALMLLREGHINEAKIIYDKILTYKTLPNLLRKVIIANIGICYWKLGHISKAIYQYQQLLENETYTNLLSANDYTSLGFLHLEQENYEQALLYTNKALELDDTCASALDNLGQMHLRQKNYDMAKKYFKEALIQNEYLPDSNYHMSIIYEMQGNLQKAITHLENALKGNITALNTVTKAMIKERLGKLS